MAELDKLRYPAGRFEAVDQPTQEQRTAWITELEELPAALRAAVEGLDASRLDTPYRDGGWTVRQVIHHMADSHLNGYVRFSLALAEDGRSAALYDQDAWAAQPFASTGDPEPSLRLLEGLHARWVATIRGLSEEDLNRTIEHPEDGAVSVDHLLNLYAWHSRHHLAHITALRERKGW